MFFIFLLRHLCTNCINTLVNYTGVRSASAFENVLKDPAAAVPRVRHFLMLETAFGSSNQRRFLFIGLAVDAPLHPETAISSL
jgi:hypothetical protein